VRLLLFGGTFNPLHWGHLLAAEELRDEFGYDLVLFVPAACPPHKTIAGDPGAEARLAMLELGVRDNPAFRVDPCELSRPGLSYTIDTLRCLPDRYDIEGKPGLLIGDDLASGFSSWRSPELIAESADIIIARRGGADFHFPYKHTRATNRLIPISSSEIRQRMAEGRSVRYLVPDPVLEYMEEKGLYEAR
jgi:nicotinate-nucleotide adenylyltransferase